MNENEIRRSVKRMYPLSKKWAKRVDRMPVYQLFAIHRRQCQIEFEEQELRKKKQEMREALLEERSEDKVLEFLQTSLF
jgi:fructosamine-3-kinase